MKNELLKGYVFYDIEEARAAIRIAIDFYNNERQHLSINMLTPVQTASMTGEIEKKWHSFRDDTIESQRTV